MQTCTQPDSPSRLLGAVFSELRRCWLRVLHTLPPNKITLCFQLLTNFQLTPECNTHLRKPACQGIANRERLSSHFFFFFSSATRSLGLFQKIRLRVLCLWGVGFATWGQVSSCTQAPRRLPRRLGVHQVTPGVEGSCLGQRCCAGWPVGERGPQKSLLREADPKLGGSVGQGTL